MVKVHQIVAMNRGQIGVLGLPSIGRVAAVEDSHQLAVRNFASIVVAAGDGALGLRKRQVDFVLPESRTG